MTSTECPIISKLFEEYTNALLEDLSETYDLPYDELCKYYEIRDHQDCLINQAFKDDESQSEKTIALAHNHLPVRWIVPDCPYCTAHGNILENLKISST